MMNKNTRARKQSATTTAARLKRLLVSGKLNADQREALDDAIYPLLGEMDINVLTSPEVAAASLSVAVKEYADDDYTKKVLEVTEKIQRGDKFRGYRHAKEQKDKGQDMRAATKTDAGSRSDKSRTQAQMLYDLLHTGAPDFVMTAIIKGIDEAAESKGLDAPTYADDETETKEQAVEKIANILTTARDYQPEALPTTAQPQLVENKHPRFRDIFLADVKRARFLACSIFPGDGFVPAPDDDIAGMLFELLNLLAKYEEHEDRTMLIFEIGVAIYPTTFEGQRVIDAYTARCAAQKARKGGRA